MDKYVMIDEYPLHQINAFVREEKYPDHYAAVCQEVQSYLTEKMADHEKGAAVFSHQDVDRCERLILSADPQNQKTGIRVLRTIVEALEPIGKTNMYGSLGYFGEKWDEDQLAVYQEYADELESQTAYFLRSLGEPDPLEISEITSLRECARLLGDYYWKVQMAYMEAGSSSVITAEINMSQIIAEQEKRRVAREQEAADAIPPYDVYCQDYSRCQIKALRGKEVAEYVERFFAPAGILVKSTLKTDQKLSGL